MEPSRQSKLTLYSLGIVVETKELKSDFIKVSPIEDLSMSNGNLADQTSKYDTNVPDSQGVKRTSKLEGESHLQAKWIPFGHSNRMTAPDVVANETVILFRFADTDQYYWTTIFREPSLRRLETAMYGFSNLPSGIKDFDKESSYWAEVSTHDKHVHIHTSKSDGEPFEYDVIIDTAIGSVTIKDNVGNFFKLDSPTNLIHCTALSEIRLEAPLIRFIGNQIVNEAPLVTNTGDEETTGKSLSNAHINCS